MNTFSFIALTVSAVTMFVGMAAMAHVLFLIARDKIRARRFAKKCFEMDCAYFATRRAILAEAHKNRG